MNRDPVNNLPKKRAGRPKGAKAGHTMLTIKMRQRLVKDVNKELKPIIKGQIDLAKGIVVEKQIKTTEGKLEPRYYRQTPDNVSAHFLLNQTIGKAEESVKFAGTIKTISDIVSDIENKNKDERKKIDIGFKNNK